MDNLGRKSILQNIIYFLKLFLHIKFEYIILSPFVKIITLNKLCPLICFIKEIREIFERFL